LEQRVSTDSGKQIDNEFEIGQITAAQPCSRYREIRHLVISAESAKRLVCQTQASEARRTVKRTRVSSISRDVEGKTLKAFEFWPGWATTTSGSTHCRSATLLRRFLEVSDSQQLQDKHDYTLGRKKHGFFEAEQRQILLPSRGQRLASREV